MNDTRKSYEQTLVEWVANEIMFNAGYKSQKITRDHLWQIYDRIVSGKWTRVDKGISFQMNGEFTTINMGPPYEDPGVMVANAMMERVTEFYKAGLLKTFHTLYMAQMGGLEALYDVGITAVARMEPGWDKVK